MTQKQFDLDERGQQIKKVGWFSWRHQSRDAHDSARERYLSEHGPAARRRKAQERAASNTPEGRLLRAVFGQSGVSA